MDRGENEKFIYNVFFSEQTSLYGIGCRDEDGKLLKEIGDITDDYMTISRFCLMLNEEKIHPYHFYDVYEDLFG